MTKNRVGGIILFLIGLAYFIASSKIPVTAISDGVNSGYWPKVASIGLMICSAGIFCSKTAKDEPSMTKAELKRAGVYLLTLIGYVLLVWLVGFIPSTLVFSFVSVILLAPKEGRPPLWKCAVFAAVFTVVLWALFDRVFLLLLPKGILF